jgi:SAM-dependent methyltransferase
MSAEKIKLNIGCGGRPLSGYINVDMDSIEALRLRYPHQQFASDIKVFNYDIFNLPYADNSVDEIMADAFIEHLSFADEKKLFLEIKRVIKPDGVFKFSVPNFEKVVKMWLEAKDDFKDFYRLDDEAIKSQHWFGNNSYTTDNRWGYLTAMIFGSQNGEGQYHVNCYTIPKIRAILKLIGFKEIEITEFLWKGDRDPMINVVAKKL